MELVYYSIVALIATVMLLIVNYDVFFEKNVEDDEAHRSYLHFITSVLVFYMADAAWGFLNEGHLGTLLYVDTVVYFIAMAFSVVLWCRYVANYLKLDAGFVKALNSVGILFCFFEIFVLILNHFEHIFFWIDENFDYHSYTFRYVALGLQIVLFASIAVKTLSIALKSGTNNRRRYVTIATFCFSMIVTSGFQVMFPLMPIYTIGMMVGTSLLYVFVQGDEKNDFRRKLQERSEIIENAGYGLWSIRVDSSGKGRIEADKVMRGILGVTHMNLDAEELYYFYRSRLREDLKIEERNYYRSMLNDGNRSQLLCWNHPQKGWIYLQATGSSRILKNGDIVISGYCADITEQRKAEEQLNASLEKAKQQAESANKAKSLFLFRMSHDIRTPMNAITGFTELLEKHLDDREKTLDYLNKIRSSNSVLLSLVNNVLEVARIESGRVSLEESLSPAGAVTKEIAAIFSERMKAKNIRFVQSVEKHTDYIYVDLLKVKEIFLNLVSNAFKYTPAGGTISIDIKELPCPREGYAKFQTRISDTGIGMSKEFLPHLFEQFVREKTVTEDKIEGTGLGMPIVKSLVELMNGTIDVESEVGKGTVFTITLTHRVGNPAGSSSTRKATFDPEYLKGKRILMAEDNDLNAEIAIEILKEAGLEVDRAEDGIVCVDMLQKKPAFYYNMILMDVQMPNMDGYKATQTIRAMEDPCKKNIPIVAMTANAFDEDRLNALMAGMNDHVAKPIDIDLLLSSIQKAMKG